MRKLICAIWFLAAVAVVDTSHARAGAESAIGVCDWYSEFAGLVLRARYEGVSHVDITDRIMRRARDIDDAVVFVTITTEIYSLALWPRTTQSHHEAYVVTEFQKDCYAEIIRRLLK